MKTYPIFAALEGRSCLVVGGGPVAERKVQDLARAGARVTVVSPRLTPALQAMAARGEIIHAAQEFTDRQVEGMALVIGATDDPQVNSGVSAAAQSRGIWVNIVDAPELCTFIVPSQVRRGDLTVAISTGGASPALARKLRLELDKALGPEYGPYAALLQAVREKVLAGRRGHPDNAQLFSRLVDSDLKEALANKDGKRINQILKEALGEILPPTTLAELANKAMEVEG